jgi:hypothetical protein
VLAVGADAGINGLRPHRCRHTFGTRLPVAKAEPTPPRSRPSSATPLSTPRPGTSAPDQPRPPPSSSASSTTDRLSRRSPIQSVRRSSIWRQAGASY